MCACGGYRVSMVWLVCVCVCVCVCVRACVCVCALDDQQAVVLRCFM